MAAVAFANQKRKDGLPYSSSIASTDREDGRGEQLNMYGNTAYACVCEERGGIGGGGGGTWGGSAAAHASQVRFQVADTRVHQPAPTRE